MSQTFKDYQKQIDDWVQGYEKPYWDPLSQLARLIEEVGEVARVLNHMYGDKVKKNSEEADDLEGEIGDILFDLMCIANSEGLDLDRAIQGTIDKSINRDSDRFKKKAQ